MVRKRGSVAPSPKFALNHSSSDEDEENRKGHSTSRRRSWTRPCGLVAVALFAAFAFLESKHPEETNIMLRKLEEDTLQEATDIQNNFVATSLVSIMSLLGASSDAKLPKKDNTIAYVVPFFYDCREELKPAYQDAGMVLRQSIHLQSVRNPLSGSEFDYQMYALTIRGEDCPDKELEALGYKVIPVETPMVLDKIKNEHVQEHIVDMDEGGEDQFIQLLAHKLVEEPIFVILYIHSLVLQPLDPLFHAMLHPKSTPEGRIARAHLASKLERPADELPAQIDHFFVRDYPNAGYARKPVVYRPGFLVARRNPAILREAVKLIHQGDYIEGDIDAGWGGRGYSMYFRNGMISGLFTYLLDEFHGDTSVELSGCKFGHNGMDNLYRNSPRFHPSLKAHFGQCRSGENQCLDCTKTDVESIFTILYDGTCHAPWKCVGEGEPGGTRKGLIDTQITSVGTLDKPVLVSGVTRPFFGLAPF
jgi:hypothetical protein